MQKIHYKNLICFFITQINHGEPVPEELYIHKSKRSLATLPDAEKIVLTRATFHEIFKKINTPGSYLEWEFETKSRDVGFGLFYQMNTEGEDKMREIVPLQRIDTEDYAEHGMYRCENPGTCKYWSITYFTEHTVLFLHQISRKKFRLYLLFEYEYNVSSKNHLKIFLNFCFSNSNTHF